jgi:hypothetical protein
LLKSAHLRQLVVVVEEADLASVVLAVMADDLEHLARSRSSILKLSAFAV